VNYPLAKDKSSYAEQKTRDTNPLIRKKTESVCESNFHIKIQGYFTHWSSKLPIIQDKQDKISKSPWRSSTQEVRPRTLTLIRWRCDPSVIQWRTMILHCSYKTTRNKNSPQINKRSSSQVPPTKNLRPCHNLPLPEPQAQTKIQNRTNPSDYNTRS
jgi:hypothetical protein